MVYGNLGIMKKEYKTPVMKVRTLSPVRMLYLSDGEVNQGNGYRSGYNDYIGGDSGSGYDYGVPD